MQRQIHKGEDGLNRRKMVVLWFFIMLTLAQGTTLATGCVDDSVCNPAFILTARHGDGDYPTNLSIYNGVLTTQWNWTYGGSKDDYATAVIQTSTRGFVLIGSTRSYGEGDYDAWMVKTDAQGVVEWTQTFGGPKYDEGNSVIETRDGGFAFVGSTRSYGAGEIDFWLIKTDAYGNMEWQQTFGGPQRDGASAIIETDDGFVLGGSTSSYGAGSTDVWLMKTDTSGAVEWQQTLGGPEIDVIKSILMIDDGFALIGYTSSYGAGGWDGWLVKTDPNGHMEWQQTFGGASDDAIWAGTQVAGEGGYVLTGYTQSYGEGSRDFWLIKTDASGKSLFNQTFGDIAFDEAWGVIETEDGYVLSGSTWSYGAGNGDAWLVKTDANGNMKWQQTFGGAEDDEARAFIKTTDDSYVIAGYSFSYGAGERDAWLVKIIPPDIDLTDTDYDGLTDIEEVEIYKTDPIDPDSDNDTYSDGTEIAAGTDPNDPNDFPKTTLPETIGGGTKTIIIITSLIGAAVGIYVGGSRVLRRQRYNKH